MKTPLFIKNFISKGDSIAFHTLEDSELKLLKKRYKTFGTIKKLTYKISSTSLLIVLDMNNPMNILLVGLARHKLRKYSKAGYLKLVKRHRELMQSLRK